MILKRKKTIDILVHNYEISFFCIKRVVCFLSD